MGVLAAERIKFTSTRSPWWCTAIIALLGLGLPVLFAAIIRSASKTQGDNLPTADATLAMAGISGFGVMVLMIMAALTVTSEYRFGIVKTTFQAIPNRSVVLGVKALLVGAFGAVLTLVLGLLAFVLAKGILGSEHGATMVLSGSAAWRTMLGVPLYAFLCSVLAVAVGALLRQSAAAIALLILWPLLIESLLGAFGSFGRNVQPFLPFANASRFFSTDASSSAANWHWGPWGGLVYFTAFVVVAFVAALVVVNRRDA